MHVHFVAIGGAGIGPIAQIAYKAGYKVSGSDLHASHYISELIASGIDNIQIGDNQKILNEVHQADPIDWVVYSSAITMSDPSPPVLEFCKTNSIKFTKRDEFINKFVSDNNLKMIAVSGTHGKTTTTAMLVWLFKNFNKPLSYLLPAKVSYGEMGDFDPKSEYFVFEADEFDRNFLAFSPEISVITGVSWDHHEIYPTQDDYKQAFNEFISKSQSVVIWQPDVDFLGSKGPNLLVEDHHNPGIEQISLKGQYNRYDGWLAAAAAVKALGVEPDQAVEVINKFPGLGRRMEEICPGLYSDYAHTPDKIRGAMSVAIEMAKDKDQSVVIIYEPLTNRRQKHMLGDYKDCFSGAKKLYWLPSYLAREDPNDRIIEPQELIDNLSDPSIADASEMDDKLEELVRQHLSQGDMVVGLTGGGANSLDNWLREHFKN